MSRQSRRDFLKGIASTVVVVASAQSVAGQPEFGIKPMAEGQVVAQNDRADVQMAEGKCGEGKCGSAMQAPKPQVAEGKCGEGKCGAAMQAPKPQVAEGKCGEGKCGANMK